MSVTRATDAHTQERLCSAAREPPCSLPESVESKPPSPRHIHSDRQLVLGLEAASKTTTTSPRHIHVHVRVRVCPIRASSNQDASSDSAISASIHPVPFRRPLASFGHGHSPAPITQSIWDSPWQVAAVVVEHVRSRQVQFSPSALPAVLSRWTCASETAVHKQRQRFPRICTGKLVPTYVLLLLQPVSLRPKIS